MTDTEAPAKTAAEPQLSASHKAPCDCVARVNKELAKDFAELDLLIFGPQVALVAATVTPNRVSKSGIVKAMKPRRTFVIPSYCPFCGTKIAGDAP